MDRRAKGIRMSAVNTQMQPQAAALPPRSHDRLTVEGEVALRRSGQLNYRVRLYDLSPDGCKAEFVERPEVDEQLWIKFDDLGAIEAEVRWMVGQTAGIRFVRPIHPAVFDALAARLSAQA
jgi:hypothetical protein